MLADVSSIFFADLVHMEQKEDFALQGVNDPSVESDIRRGFWWRRYFFPTRSQHTQRRNRPRGVVRYVGKYMGERLPATFFFLRLSLKENTRLRFPRQNKHRWVLTSIFYMELLGGAAMLVIGSLLVTFRWPELCQVRQAKNRCRVHVHLIRTRWGEGRKNNAAGCNMERDIWFACTEPDSEFLFPSRRSYVC